MEWIDFWQAIEYLFMDVLLVPLDWLRTLQFDTWWGANTINWIFILTAAGYFCYWLKQLQIFHDAEKENASHSEH